MLIGWRRIDPGPPENNPWVGPRRKVRGRPRPADAPRAATPVDAASRRRAWLVNRNGADWRWAGVVIVGLLLALSAHARRPRTRSDLERTTWSVTHLDAPSHDHRRLAALHLLEIGQRQDLVDRLLQLALKGDDAAMAQLACVMQEPDRQRVRDLMHGSHPELRVRTLRLLRPVANHHDVHRFTEALQHPDARVRAAAARALAGPEPRDPRLVGGLTELVHDPVLYHRDVEDDVVLREVRASREVAARATELLTDPSPEVRTGAAELVALLSPEEAVR